MAEARVLNGGGSCFVWQPWRLAFVWRRFVFEWRRLMAAGDSLPSLKRGISLSVTSTRTVRVAHESKS